MHQPLMHHVSATSAVLQTSPQLGWGGRGKSSKHTSPHLYRLTHTLKNTRALMSTLVYAALCSHLCILGQKWLFCLNGQQRGRSRSGSRLGRVEIEGEMEGRGVQRCFLTLADKNNAAGLYCLCIYFKETISSDSAATPRISFRRSNDTRRVAVNARVLPWRPALKQSRSNEMSLARLPPGTRLCLHYNLKTQPCLHHTLHS